MRRILLIFSIIACILRKYNVVIMYFQYIWDFAMKILKNNQNTINAYVVKLGQPNQFWNVVVIAGHRFWSFESVYDVSTVICRTDTAHPITMTPICRRDDETFKNFLSWLVFELSCQHIVNNQKLIYNSK